MWNVCFRRLRTTNHYPTRAVFVVALYERCPLEVFCFVLMRYISVSGHLQKSHFYSKMVLDESK